MLRYSNNLALPKKCAIVTDGDLSPDDADESIEGEDELLERLDLKELEGDFVKVFSCQTTFERACVFQETLEMFARTASDVGATTVAKRLREGLAKLKKEKLSDAKRREILDPLRDAVLNTAKRFWKGQVCADSCSACWRSGDNAKVHLRRRHVVIRQ